MTKWRSCLLLVVILAVSTFLYLFEGPGDIRRLDSGQVEVRSSDHLRRAGAAESQAATEEPEDTGSGAAGPDAESVVNCLSESQLESHPLLSDEWARLDSLSVTGPTIASYRGLSDAELENLVAQGDSAAMAVLGAISFMRARGLDDGDAVSYLLNEESRLNGYSFTRPLDEEVRTNYEQARDWFYQAALHGRPLSLQKVGEITWVVNGGPVALGWIGKDDYESLNSFEKGALDPIMVYQELATVIAPQLGSGPIWESVSEHMPRIDQQQNVLDELARQFVQDLGNAGLPPIEVPESTAPALQELRSMLCDPDGVL